MVAASEIPARRARARNDIGKKKFTEGRETSGPCYSYSLGGLVPRMRSTSRFLSLLVILVAQPVLAWNATGHEAIAAIAWDNMQPATRTKVAALLGAAVQG